MKTTHFLCSLLTASALFGCGGSELSDVTGVATSPPPVSPAFTLPDLAPAITGDSSVSLLATQPQRIEFQIENASSDTLSVSVMGVKNWATAHLSGNSVTVDLTPGLFEVGEHTLTLIANDGKAESVHKVALQVNDNPDAYQTIELTPAVISGHWVFDNGSELHIYDNARGLYKSANDTDYFPVTWNIPNATQAHIVVNQPACGTCWVPHDAFAMEIVAQKDDQIRARFTEGGNVRTVANGVAIKERIALLNDGNESERQYFTYLGANNGNRASYIDTATSEFSLVIPITGKPNVDSHRSNAHLSGSFSIHNNQIQFTPDQTSYALAGIYERFGQAQTGLFDGFYFNYTLESLESRFTSSSLRILKAVLTPQLDKRHGNVVLADYPQMSEFLGQKITVWAELQPLIPVEHIALQMGTPYYSVFQYESRFRYADRTFDLFNANQLVLDSPTRGRLILENAHEPAKSASVSVDVAASGNILTLSQGKNSQRYGFYRDVRGSLLSVWLDSDDQMVVPVVQNTAAANSVAVGDITEQLLLVNGRGIHSQNKRFLKYTPGDATAGYRADIHVTSESADSSLLMAMSLDSDIRTICDGLNFNDCFAREQKHFLETSDRSFVTRRLKLIDVQGDRYFIQNNETYFINGYLFSSGQLLEMVRLGF